MTRLIDPAGFRRFAPAAIPGALEALDGAALALGLTQRLPLAHWLGQMRVESKGFSTMTESLNYSVEGLMATFGRHRITAAECQRLGRIDKVSGGRKTVIRAADQRAIANRLYGGEFGRKNLGNTEPDDGWTFRGGGFKQITGRANYREAGHEDSPDVLRTDVVASAIAAANFFLKHGCVEAALRDDVTAVTERVNGGHLGLAERLAATKAAKGILL